MSDTGLVPLFEVKFSTYLELLLQQMGSKLRSTVRETTFTGAKIASPVQQIGAVQTRQPAGRYAPLDPIPHNYVRRWVSPTDRELPQLIDNFDKLKTQIDPQSEFVESAAMACGRDWDDAIIAAATGNATLGADPASFTTEQFSTANFQIAADFGASASTGLTVKKLNEARRILEHYHNDLDRDPATVIIGSQQHADLRDQAQVVSSDFNRNGGVLENGKVTYYMGFRIIVMERLPIITDKDSNTNTRGCLCYVQSGLHLGMWQDVATKISQRDDLSSQPWQVYTKHSFGATRTQPGKVLQICAADTTGADITP